MLHPVQNPEQSSDERTPQEAGRLPAPRDVGARLRELRESSGLSQRALARAAGVTNATVSNIEANAVSPSVASLRKLVRAMGVSLADFFATADEGAPRPFYGASELVEIGSGPVSLRLVAAGVTSRQLQVLHECYAPGADTGAEMLSHPGEEAGIVVSGEITITVGALSRVLGPGDAWQFPSEVPHRFRNDGSAPCVLVSASTPPTF